MALPHGFPQLIATYGDPRPFVNDKPGWEAQTLVTIPLPTPLPYAYVQSTDITKIRAHTLVASQFVSAFTACLSAGVPRDRLIYGGIYAWRAVRGQTRLSTHTWGIAVDLDPGKNPLGQHWRAGVGMLPETIIDVFRTHGFVWGGDWSRPDPQHFQLVDGY